MTETIHPEVIWESVRPGLLAAAARAHTAPPSLPPAYEAVAKAKAKRDQQSWDAYRAVDQELHERAHERRVTAAVEYWENEVSLFRGDIEVVEPDAAEALAAQRAAEDRHREAVEDARQQRAAYERVRGGGRPKEETEALVRADAADQTAWNARKAAEEAAAEWRGLDRDLAEARDGLAAAERQLQAARTAAEAPAGTAPVSDVTLRANAQFMQSEMWESLSRDQRIRVNNALDRGAISPREWLAMMNEGTV